MRAFGATTAKSSIQISGSEARLLRPTSEPIQMSPELVSQRGEPVTGTARMVDQASHPKLAQSLCKHARGHPRHPRRKITVGHRVGMELPDDPQRPASAQHIEQREQARLIVSVCACRAPYLRQRSVLTGSDLAPVSTVASATFSQPVKCLDFRCNLMQARRGRASDFDAPARRALGSVRHDRGRPMT
jgi:hypothetical protein